MSDQLRAHIEKFVKIDEQDYPEILAYFKPVQVPKKKIYWLKEKFASPAILSLKGV